jgi:hypothetical protein
MRMGLSRCGCGHRKRGTLSVLTSKVLTPGEMEWEWGIDNEAVLDKVWPGCSLFSFGSVRGSREAVIAVITRGEQSGPQEMIAPAPGCSLVIRGSCCHLGGGLSCKTLLFLGDVLRSVLSSWCPRWLKEMGVKWRQEGQASTHLVPVGPGEELVLFSKSSF